ncbi:MAG: glycosyltransferase family 2 protein [Fusicatenibacter sp.]|nr:glycosyltransferase family 2 protein [Lachnospiraceae bacterium]MDY2938994.1 glycosyltransferase family 2 protein [Fusicatenibacter sp.]
MKILSFAVPCYNSEAYMEKCIDSLLVGGEEVEILIIDDGSKDQTAAIADRYQEQYPTIVRAIHQENKGHGGAVNTGIANATGLYFKVVDSDDWVNPDAYRKILSVLEEVIRGPKTLDLLISNYVYEKEGAKRKRVMRYAKALPEGEMFGWNETKSLGHTHYLLMHSMIYRTSLLRECKMELPEHTFYVDNLVAFVPLPYVKTMYYVDENFYRYYIGRSDQSVNEKVMISRIDQQIRVNKLMIDYMGEQKNLGKRMRNYMVSYLAIIMTVSSVMMMRSETKENLEKKNELWKYLKQKDSKDYLRIRHGLFGTVMSARTKPGQKIAVYGYKAAQKLYGFN